MQECVLFVIFLGVLKYKAMLKFLVDLCLILVSGASFGSAKM
jgi:hypothetical protein